MKLSLVIPYYNRRTLLINVLNSIHPVDMETIIVDDGSSEEQRVDNLIDLYPLLNLCVIRIGRDKKWRGPTIAYNVGFSHTSGDIIIINSSECIHVGDITGFVERNLKEDDYITFSALMGTPGMVGKKFTLEPESFLEETKIHRTWWGVHTTIKNFIPYCAAISRKNLNILGGYDMRYAAGVGWDDYDFTHRVRNLGLNMRCIDNPFCYHQYHTPTNYPNYNNLKLLEYLNINDPKRIKACGI